MKFMYRMFFLIVSITLILSTTFAQADGDYESSATGNWGDANSWEVFSTPIWNLAATPPPGTSETITIQSGHTITVAAPITIAGASVVIDGYLKDVGIITPTSGTWTVNNGATYELAHAPASGTGIPTATWNTGSTCLITGVTTVTTGINANQNFYNLTVNCPLWTGNLNLGWNTGTVTINGNLTILNTGASGRCQMSAPTTGNSVTVNINGNLIVDGSATDATNKISFTATGSGNGLTTIIINIMGDVIVTGNPTNRGFTNFSLCRGSQAGTGTTTWNLYGNVTIANDTMNNSNSAGAKFVFKKAGTQTLSMTNIGLGGANNMQVDNGSTVQLTSAISYTNGTFTLTNGKVVTTNSNLLTVGSSATLTGGSSSSYIDGPLAHTWTASTATRIYPIGKGSAYRPLAISLTTPASPVVRAEVFNTNAGGSSSLNAISIVRYYQTALISGTGTSGGSVKITYDADDGVTDHTTLEVAQSSTVNGTYSSIGRSASDVTSVTSGTAYNPVAGDFLLLGSTASNPLPVELTAFSGTQKNKVVELQWKTATEVNNKGFEVERSDAGGLYLEGGSHLAWVKVGFVEGNGTTNAPKAYTFTDAVIGGGTYAYRLKQIDRDGKFSYSNTIEVATPLTANDYQLSQNFPNPFNPSTTITFAVQSEEHATVKVFNTLGQEVATLFNDVAQPDQMYTLKFDGKNLSSGIYFYTLRSNSRNETKKMMLNK